MKVRYGALNMTNRVGQYGISNEADADFLIIQEAVDTLKSLGKAKVYPYGNGQICFHHKGDYFFISPYTFKWSPRHRCNEKWRKPKELTVKGCFEDIERWCAFKKRKQLENKE
jgi:hypothetical protein